MTVDYADSQVGGPMAYSCRYPVFFLAVVSLQTAGPYSVAPAAAAATMTTIEPRLTMNFLVVAEAEGTMCVKENPGPASSIARQETRSLTDCWRGDAGLLR